MPTPSSFRPFTTFELKPFLVATPDDLAQIQKKYLLLSRQHHPDRVSQSDTHAQEQAEDISSKLNFDFSQLKDFWKLVEVVLSQGLQNAACPIRSPHQSPPELAVDYFELQEKLAEMPKGSAEAKKLMHEFKGKVQVHLSQKEKSVLDFASQFRFQGFGVPKAPWKNSDLLKLQDLLEQVRYYRSFMKDIDQKMLQF